MAFEIHADKPGKYFSTGVEWGLGLEIGLGSELPLGVEKYVILYPS